MAQLNLNYIPGFVKLAEHHRLADEPNQAETWAARAEQLATNAGNDELIKFIQSKGF